MGANWKTTAAGIVAIVVAVLGAAGHLLQGQPVDWTSVASSVMAGIGLIKAADSVKVG